MTPAEAILDGLADLIATEVQRQVAEIVRAEVQRQVAEITTTPDTAPTKSPYMTTSEAGEHLRLTAAQVRDRIYTGALTAHKQGGRLLLLRSEVEASVRLDRPRRERARA
ncbi:MAG: helix-turn-helix domain-containing protein [Thermoleophilia bacterium]